MSKDNIYCYRYDYASRATGFLSDGSTFGNYVTITLFRFPVLRFTEKGMWIDMGLSQEKFIRTYKTRKKYAHLSKRDAMISFIARKKKQKKILQAQLSNVSMALDLVIDKDIDDLVDKYDTFNFY